MVSSNVAVVIGVIAIILVGGSVAFVSQEIQSLRNDVASLKSETKSSVDSTKASLEQKITSLADVVSLYADALGLDPTKARGAIQEREKAQARYEAAKKEGKVLVYGSIDAEDFAPLGEAFKRRYPGIQLDYVRGAPSQVYTRVTSEIAAKGRSADLVIISYPTMFQMQAEGLFVDYVAAGAKDFPKTALDPKNGMTPIIGLAQTFIYNTNLVKSADVPKTLDDLTNAKWKGKVISHDPTIGSTATQLFASLGAVLGDDKVTSFLTKLKQNVDPVLTTSTSSVTDGVVRGEYAIGLVAQLHDVIRNKAAGAPVAFLRIEGVPLMVTTSIAGVLKTAEHPEAAKLLVDFLASQEGQTIIGNIDVRFPVRTDLPVKYSLDLVAPGIDKFYYPTADAIQKSQEYKDRYTKIFK